MRNQSAFTSPLMEKVTNRKTGMSFKSEPQDADYDDTIVAEAEEVTDAELASEQAYTTPPPRQRRTGGAPPPPHTEDDSPEEPDIAGFADPDDMEDLDHATDAEKEQAREKSRRMLIKSVLEGVDFLLPAGASELSKIPTRQISVWEEQGTVQKGVTIAIENKNKKDKQTFEKSVNFFTKQLEDPLRQVMKDRQVNISPETQIVVLCICMVASLGYFTYTIRQENQRMFKDLEKLHTITLEEIRAKTVATGAGKQVDIKTKKEVEEEKA